MCTDNSGKMFTFHFGEKRKNYGSGGVTVAVTEAPIHYPDNQPDWWVYKISFSFCSPKDHYSKKMGRLIAGNRVRSDHTTKYGIKTPDQLKIKDMKEIAYKTLINKNDEGWPSWLPNLLDKINIETNINIGTFKIT